MSLVDRGPLHIEIAKLRDRVCLLEEENRQLREAMSPVSLYPAAWGLTVQEGQALHALNRMKGRVISKESMMVWLYGFGAEIDIKIVDVLVCKLRRKLKPFGVEIKTAWGSGYSLTPASLPIVAAVSSGEARAA